MHNCKKIINGDGASGWCEERGLADASGWYEERGLADPLRQRRHIDRVVPVTLAGKGTPSNIQNELGPGIGAEGGGRRAEDYERRRTCAASHWRWPPPSPAAAAPHGDGRNSDTKRKNSFFFWQPDRSFCRSSW